MINYIVCNVREWKFSNSKIFYILIALFFDLSEHLRKENIIDDDDLDTIEYDDIRTYIFRPDLSNNLTGDEIVTTIHPGKSANVADEGGKK